MCGRISGGPRGGRQQAQILLRESVVYFVPPVGKVAAQGDEGLHVAAGADGRYENFHATAVF